MNTKNPDKIKKFEILELIQSAIREDLGGYGDISSKYLFPQEQTSSAFIICKEKEATVLSGMDVAGFVFEEVDSLVSYEKMFEDGQTVKSAFIHFDYWYNNNNAKFLRDKLNTSGQFKQKGFYDGSNTHRFMVRNDNGDKVPGYFVFKINHKPIPEVEETELNMSQLVAANKVLE